MRLFCLLLVLAACRGEDPPIFDCDTDPCEDCAFIAAELAGRPDDNFDLAECQSCQAAVCGTAGCENYPCAAGVHVVRACDVDDDCAGLSPFCGHYTGRHHVCVLHDDV